ncbi:Sir2 histone deacetylase Hst2 [Myotisia sp. PD_48]|nr:Sir2 histone deacetylase Hst2 [Myotisia sp. PD_48]
MGQEASKPIDDSVSPRTLESRTIQAVAKRIQDGKITKVVVMTGAGISTSAGIPDFRSPDTGIYANLARLNLPHPEAVFDISYFRKNPHAFYALAKEMFPGKYRPTLTHSFIKLLHDKGLLLKLFTQNIDCLERAAGLPGDKIVEAHGSFASHACIECKSAYPDDLMRKAIDANDIPKCSDCKGLVKPNIVFFGESLPASFFEHSSLPSEADLCIIMGTSLSVQPFASLPSLCREETPRILINLERAGSIGSRPDDVLVLGDCDEGVRRLAAALGWMADLDQLWAETALETVAEALEGEETKKPISRDELLHDEVERLAGEVEATLHVSQAHSERLRAELQDSKEQSSQEKVDQIDAKERTETPTSEQSSKSKESDQKQKSTSPPPIEGSPKLEAAISSPEKASSKPEKL